MDAFIAKAGLRMVNTLHTSNVADGKIQLQDGQIFNMDINMPSDRIELFDFRFSIFSQSATRGSRMEGIRFRIWTTPTPTNHVSRFAQLPAGICGVVGR